MAETVPVQMRRSANSTLSRGPFPVCSCENNPPQALYFNGKYWIHYLVDENSGKLRFLHAVSPARAERDLPWYGERDLPKTSRTILAPRRVPVREGFSVKTEFGVRWIDSSEINPRVPHPPLRLSPEPVKVPTFQGAGF